MESENLNPIGNVTALCQYYRAEMARANTWRSRLDVTTNWAIITTAAFLSVAFGSPNIPHFVIILATIFVLFFLIIESRRYKYFDLWRWRIALLNENFFPNVILPGTAPIHADWREQLSSELKNSSFKISFREAFGRRLRRNYGWIFMVLASCWLAKVVIHPTPMENISEIFERATIFDLVHGSFVLGIGVIFNSALIIIALTTVKKRNVEVQIKSARRP